MALFQRSVLNKYLKEIDDNKVNAAYQKFTAYFHNPTIQENIKTSKEEQFQEGFLRELFVDILGFVLNPQPDYNLTTEFKNQRGAKKADGAVLKEGKAIGVIELKSTKTKDLESVRQQAFDYKANQPHCVYVITSNFEKLRFYINNAVDYEEFDLFNLQPERFKLLYLCLQADNLLRDLPLQVKEASLIQEENITKQLYKDYSQFKHELFADLCANNLDKPVLAGMAEKDAQLLLFKKSQKLLDRFLFIFFAEDSGLLPPNSISEIIEQWETLQELDEDIPLYSRYRKYFGYLNTGWKGKKYEIFAYNGGLFEPDEVLDSIEISDNLLHQHTKKLSTYDFGSEVDVNILGHIFENSLNEIEEVTAKLERQEADTKKGKRKKDGVFYTPKYITKYIVDNTVGKLCGEKKTELGIVEEDYLKSRKGRKKDTLKALDAKLKTYRDWLLGLTICDPACGSGAFLNQALDFLINEHQYIDELNAKLLGSSLVFPDISNQILEQNIYGVDINEESVEIAKLSMWLRTAQKGRKLSTLSSNIKCGNSLIDDPEVAGEKAFNWQEQFPEVFEKGGFDVVIGNPPYVSSKGETIQESIKKHLTSIYKTAAYQIDLYILFLEKSLDLVDNKSLISFIVPNSWLNNLLLKPVRTHMLKSAQLKKFVIMPPNTFTDANVDTVITTYAKGEVGNQVELLKCENAQFTSVGYYNQTDWLNNEDHSINVYLTKEKVNILRKVEKESVNFGEIAEIVRGVGVYHKRIGHTKEFIASDPYQSVKKKDETFVPYLRGKNLSQWLINWEKDSFISYGNWLAEPRKLDYFQGERLLIRKILSSGIVATYIDTQFVVDQQLYTAIIKKNEFETLSILPLICSKLMSYYFRLKYSEFDDLFPQIKLNHVKSLPINNSLKITTVSSRFTSVAKSMLGYKQKLNSLRLQFVNLFKHKHQIDKTSSKMTNWIDFEFIDFLKEIKKAKVKLSLSEEAGWLSYFEEQKAKVIALQAQITQTETEIDQLVYQLYGLTEEEIKIVEGGVD